MQIHILGIALLAVTFTTAQAVEFLTEKPNVLVPCSLDDPNISNCLAKSLQDIFVNWADEIPGKDVFGLTDPFTLDNYIETKEISGFDGRPITIHNEFLNFSVSGLSQGIISAASYREGFASASLDIPKLILNFDFKATIEDGKNITKIDDKVEMNLIGLTIDFSANLQRRETPKATFLDFSKVENHLQASDIQILSEADPDKSFNRYISDPENDFSGIFKAWDRNWVDPLLLKRVNKIFNYIPANFIIKNI
ncbi:uncharacterized protein LOC132786115 [Drosophila nasuta]|uniref:uncharacterized protein LOC132786115 n=1 Tax=Drosophila nasuta TaxID=42062 RepID=UPI00295EF531|nr:uncharacterized protein LOC132786115 [Drosophila nasuta]